MTNHVANLPVEGPTQDDCGRLILHLRDQYIPSLRLEVGFYQIGKAGWGLKMEILDDCVAGVDGKEVVNVWATATIGQRIMHISTNQLYDLLMTAYRQIDRYFELGEAFAPARRVK